ncbi:hypothetical protein BH09ACT13_BH09ACT13_15790 [soil metagenome]
MSPGAAEGGIVGRHGDAWKIRVSAAPERGKANQAVLELLSNVLQVPRGSLEFLAGHGGRDKVVSIAGITRTETERRLAGAVAATS